MAEKRLGGQRFIDLCQVVTNYLAARSVPADVRRSYHILKFDHSEARLLEEKLLNENSELWQRIAELEEKLGPTNCPHCGINLKGVKEHECKMGGWAK